MARRIFIAVSLIVAIPLLVFCYLVTDTSSAVSMRGLIIAATCLIGLLGAVGLHHLTATLKELCANLKTVAAGGADRTQREGPADDIKDLATSINQVSQRLRESADELEKRMIVIQRFKREFKRTDEVQSEYFSTIVHELRTPLINIEKNSAVLMEKGPQLFHEEQSSFAKNINNSVHRLIRMTSDLLDISKMQAGRFSMKFEMVGVDDIIADAVGSVDQWRRSKNLTLDVAPPGYLPKICADRDRVVQVFVNLLSNAIKFTAPGGRVTLSCEKAGLNKGRGPREGAQEKDRFVTFSIRDTGVGIPATRLETIFERYHATAGSPSDKVPNTGLGLSIARQIVEMHGGKMGVESRVGEGTCFTFTLPLRPSKDVTDMIPSSAAPATEPVP